MSAPEKKGGFCKIEVYILKTHTALQQTLRHGRVCITNSNIQSADYKTLDQIISLYPEVSALYQELWF